MPINFIRDDITVGISDRNCDVPEGWHELAAENSATMEIEKATMKYLCLYSNEQSVS
jgi:uncharacterized membrane protein